ncbi:MAG: aminoacyl-tRNA hydrolase [Patescibacteria group bacterium]|nr:aminoacyl-tRNA hydrolase [Patescibacteria group bacterium]MDD5164820.1 aminoacyl-tRNA hydrolase [Patescibacteria group bacterium]MDD5534454.1 aminoacyl-tRNA hydrolase [Patescibacteria group bacterium]
MIFIIGLGNPGEQYKNTRHNIGQKIVMDFAKTFDFPTFKLNKNFKAEISKKGEVCLVIPTTFMNESGLAVKILNSKFQIPNSNLWVIHDDMDLPLGKIRISINRSSAGHNGVQSIIDNLKTKNFVRFRIGINHSAQNQSRRQGVGTPTKASEKAMDLVLKNFSVGEKKLLKQTEESTVEAISAALEQGIEKTMSLYN